MSRPWFPLYVGDYVRDTARLTTEGHGAYLLLMLDYWVNGAPPDDDETLSSIARLSLDVWLRLRHKLAPFFSISDGKWTHGRIEKEMIIANEKHQKRVDAGKSGGIAKAKAQQYSGNATPELSALLYQSQSQSQPLKKVLSRSKPTEGETSRFDEFWKAYPRRDGPNPRKPAETKFNALVKSGVDPAMMIAAAAKLAAAESAKGNVGTRFIPQAMTWLNQQRWADHAAIAFVAGASEMPIEDAVKFFAKTHRWSRWAGPEPGHLGCRASPELMAKYGMRVDGRKLEVA